MTTYAYAPGGNVQAVFFSDQPRSAFPDIEPDLHEVPETVREGWVYDGGQFRPYRLTEGRAQAIAAIKAERDRRTENGGYKVTVGGVDRWFHSDPKSRTQQLGLVLMGANVPPVQWKTMDGSFVTMTAQLAQAVFHAAAASDIAIFGVAEQHLAAVAASDDPLAYNWATGWPPEFGA